MAAYLAGSSVLLAYIMHTYEAQQGMLAYSTGQRLGSIITKKSKRRRTNRSDHENAARNIYASYQVR